jgi:hypothetical protein
VTFLALSSWDADAPASGDQVLQNGASGVGIFAGIDALATTWETRGCEGFDAAKAWNLQPGHSGLTMPWTVGAGPYTAYHFWQGDEDGNDYIHITVESVAGLFQHWALGQVVPFGTVTGGVYVDATFLNTGEFTINDPSSSSHVHLCDSNSDGLSHIRVDYDGNGPGHWGRVMNASTTTANFSTGSTRHQGIYEPQIQIGYQRYNLRTPLWPMIYFANRASALRSPIGRMPNIRQVNMRNLFPGEELSVGGDVWKCFPVFARNVEAVAPSVASSGLYGYAHLMP